MGSPDLQRLVALIREEVASALGGQPAVARPPAELLAADVARLIDHTLLKADATAGQVEQLCAEAREYRFATVCVNPVWVATASRLLAGSGIGVSSVVGFPLGATPPEVKRYEARRALLDGATEIDVVMNIGALRSGDLCGVDADLAAVVAACRDAGAVSKIIIEAALLTDEEKVAACVLARLAGADYVKTSTGFGPGGATAGDVALMRRVVGAAMGVKAAGGVRDLAAVRALVAAGASRIGTSAGVRIVQESRAETNGAPPADPQGQAVRSAEDSGAGDGDRTRDQQLGKL